ncbi:uncharacterized protein BDV17DRAFT_45299 [Aspergillus undulatus]|uniref:uncharacterized protein n=1 Tax=Aspergillus undulatus TaxID=1810928 RepID=UPI003CCD6358
MPSLTNYYCVNNSCSKPYVVKAGDTIGSIAGANSVSTHWLLMFTAYDKNPSIVPIEGDEICLSGIPTCLIHRVSADDTCSSLLTLAGPDVTERMLYIWNPKMGRGCKNIASMVGKYICTGPLGQEKRYTRPTIPEYPRPTRTTSTRTYTLEPMNEPATGTISFVTGWTLKPPRLDQDVVNVYVTKDTPEPTHEEAHSK